MRANRKFWAGTRHELNIGVIENFYLLKIIEQGGILRLKLTLDRILFVSEAVSQALNTWLKCFSQEEPSKTVGEKIELVILQFLAFSIRISNVNKLTIESAAYLLEVLTKCMSSESNLT